MRRLYEFIDVLNEEYILILDKEGLGYELPIKEVKSRYNNDEIISISIEPSESQINGMIIFIKINGICQNEG